MKQIKPELLLILLALLPQLCQSTPRLWDSIKPNTHNTNHVQDATNTEKALDAENSNKQSFQKNTSRKKRFDSENTVFLANLAIANVPCPTTECDCSENNGSYILNCRYKNLRKIPYFKEVDTVFSHILFYANEITEIKQVAFQNLKVQTIDMSGISLSNIEDGAFTGLETSLIELKLKGNGAKPLPFQKISNLGRLQILQLENFNQSQLSSLPSNFKELLSLTMKDIKGLRHINNTAFVNKLPKLQTLYIEKSQISSIPVGSLAAITMLSTLALRDGNISTIYDQTFDKFKLQTLDLHGNKIRDIKPDAFLGIHETLEQLDLSLNRLTTMSLEALSSKLWSKLQYLKLSYNNLHHIPDNIFRNMQKLQYLFLQETGLTHVSPSLFGGLSALHTLDLSYNKISFINASSFVRMRLLEELKLDRQFYKPLQDPLPTEVMTLDPESFYGLQQSLKRLNMASTPLYENQFWQAVRVLESLEELDISKVRISYIQDDGFEKNKKLKEIDLGMNDITKISDTAFWSLRDTLESITLRNNSIKTISECVFKNFTKLNQIDLQFNFLKCDCKVKWLQEFIEKKLIHSSIYKKNFVCGEPSKFEGISLSEIQPTDLVCVDDTPATCKTPHGTEQATTTVTTVLTSMTTTKTPVFNRITIDVIPLKNSLLVTWGILENSSVTGYVLEYYPLLNEARKEMIQIHKNNLVHTLVKLPSGTYFKVCVTAEINGIVDDNVKSCQTVQTSPDNAPFTGKESDDAGANKNIIVAAVLASVVFVILVIIGIYSVVKYKLQKLQMMQTALGLQAPRVLFASTEGLIDDNKKCAIYTVGNVYTDIQDASKYSTVDYRTMLKDPVADMEAKKTARYYSTYRKVKPNKQGKKELSLEGNSEVKPTSHEDKSNVGSRHSAPSRIEASSSNANDRRSRPLPALPSGLFERENKTKIREEKTNQNRLQVMTQASVYENKSTDHLFTDGV